LKELRKPFPDPAELLQLSPTDLAWTIFKAVQERGNDRIHRINRNTAVSELFEITDRISPMAQRTLEQKLNPAFRKAFGLLESWGLVEPEEGINGDNGRMVLTEKGSETNAPIDIETLRQRQLLRPEMLHPLLREDVYADFLAGKFGKAVFGAFRTMEIEIRRAAGLSDDVHGATLMQTAFNETNGILSEDNESQSQRKALRLLFEGAFGRFRNPEAHAERVFADPFEAMQELMIASRLLKLVHERPAHEPRPRKGARK
jgi:uncharacterized protein (TIGR02391 family)